jgi:4-amino-4-deoxy-L-arabinose transferase-like glycosyltransferase
MTGASDLAPPRRLSRYRFEIAIFAVALALRVALFIAVGPWDPARLRERILVGDARDYQRLATNLVERGVYSSMREPPFTPSTFRVPLYAGYLALVYRLAGPSPHWAILVQLVLGALTCVVVCAIGTEIFDRRSAIVAGFVLALDYASIVFSNRLYADSLFTLLIALALYALARFVVAGGARSLAAAGVFLGLATLCRPVSLYLVLALLPVVWLRLRSARRALASWGLLLLVYLATLGPWMIRNHRVSGHFYVTSMQTQLGTWYLPRVVGAPLSPTRPARRPAPTPSAADVVGGAPAAAPTPRGWREPSLARLPGDLLGFGRGFVRYFAILGSGEIPLILGIPYRQHDAVGLREANLGRWIASTLQNRSSPLERTLVLLIAAYLAALYLAAARGVWVAFRDRRRLEATLLITVIVYFMIATGPISREVRYRLPITPAIALFAGLGLTPRRDTTTRQPGS